MRTVKFKVYTINEHPEKEKCFEWIRNNWHDLSNYALDEFIYSLTKLADKINGKLDYCISVWPDIGEYIYIKNYDKDLLNELKKDDLPLTGVCWDYDVIHSMQNGELSEALNSLHKYTEYLYSDEGLTEFCKANEYEFFENGKVY